MLAPPASAHPRHNRSGLDAHQRAQLREIAADTWRFFKKDVDPTTHLPLDNLGPGTTRGNYTSSANVGVYLWSVVAAHDLHIISTREADARVRSTLREVQKIKRSHGFLYQWYDTTTGETILNPGDKTCAQDTSTTPDNCTFLSAVDNGWYASGLVVAREALPDVSKLATSLLNQMDFSIFYDNRAQKAGCNTNPDLNNEPTGQMYGGYNVGFGPATYHNGAIYSDPRIAMYLGMGLHQMPGDVWWRTWRTLPPKQCSTDPDFSWQGQAPGGQWTTIHDPLSGKDFRVWEGHYTYPGTSLKYPADLGRRDVRRADGQRGSPRDDVGTAQLRPRRPAHRARADQVRHPGSLATRCGACPRRVPLTIRADTPHTACRGSPSRPVSSCRRTCRRTRIRRRP